jgi:hypothetical protein
MANFKSAAIFGNHFEKLGPAGESYYGNRVTALVGPFLRQKSKAIVTTCGCETKRCGFRALSTHERMAGTEPQR